MPRKAEVTTETLTNFGQKQKYRGLSFQHHK